MKVIEYLKEENYKDLSSEQRRFAAIQLIKDVSDYAMVHNISSDEAYEICSRDSIWSDLGHGYLPAVSHTTFLIQSE